MTSPTDAKIRRLATEAYTWKCAAKTEQGRVAGLEAERNEWEKKANVEAVLASERAAQLAMRDEAAKAWTKLTESQEVELVTVKAHLDTVNEIIGRKSSDSRSAASYVYALKAEIERLQAVKRRALAIADERGKEADALRAALAKERDTIENEARRYAEHYPPASDGRNTFILLAEWIEARNHSTANTDG